MCVQSPTHPNIHPTVFPHSPRPTYSSGLKYANFIHQQQNVLDENVEKAKYMFTSRRQNAGQNYNLLLFCYLLITLPVFQNILFFTFVYCFLFLFPILCILCFCIILCIVSPSIYIFVQIYRQLSPVETQLQFINI